jgi:hypothetical protein
MKLKKGEMAKKLPGALLIFLLLISTCTFGQRGFGKGQRLSVDIIGPKTVSDKDSVVVLEAYAKNIKRLSSYNWQIVSGESRGIPAGKKYKIDVLKPGIFKIKVTVGGDSYDIESETYSVTVTGSKQKEVPISNTNIPRIHIIAPSSITDSSNLSLKTIIENNVPVQSYRWEKITRSGTETLAGANSEISIGRLDTGRYSFKVIARDLQGRSVETIHTVKVTQSPVLITSFVPPVPLEQKPRPLGPGIRGGPGNAILNLLLPGLGHYHVSGNQFGEDKKPLSFLITFAYLGSAGASVYYKLKANEDYNKYKELASFRERQYDPAGVVIGIRGANASDAETLFAQAEGYNKNFVRFATVGVSILAIDFLYTWIKGSINSNRYHKQYSINKKIFYNPLTKQAGVGYVVNF